MDLSLFYSEEGVALSPPSTKSLADVERVVEKHKGRNDRVVDMFITSYLLGLQWQWYEDWNEWKVSYAAAEKWNREVAGTVSGRHKVWLEPTEPDSLSTAFEWVDEYHPTAPLPEEPSRPSQSLSEWKLSNYAMLRAAAYPSVEAQLGMKYDDMVNGTTTWVESQIEIKEQYPKEAPVEEEAV